MRRSAVGFLPLLAMSLVFVSAGATPVWAGNSFSCAANTAQHEAIEACSVEFTAHDAIIIFNYSGTYTFTWTIAYTDSEGQQRTLEYVTQYQDVLPEERRVVEIVPASFAANYQIVSVTYQAVQQCNEIYPVLDETTGMCQ